MSGSKRGSRRARTKKVLVFGEDENDTKAIAEFLAALRPELDGMVKVFRKPPILIKDAHSRDVPSRAESIAALIDAELVDSDVICVFAHEDCDDFDPAHERLAKKIEDAFAGTGHHVHAVTPAWELEAWFFQWPDAVASYRPSWASLDPYRGRDTGRIKDAKEELRRALRPKSGTRTRDYRESDAAAIAGAVREAGVVRTPVAKNASCDQFRQAVDGCDALAAI